MAVKSASDVRAAGIATLQAHLPAHLAALSRPLPAPSSYSMVITPENVRRVSGAVCAVASNGLEGEPTRNGDGSYDGWFSLNIALFHQPTNTMPLLVATGDFAAAIMECLIQNPSLGGFAAGFRLKAHDTDLVGDALSPVNLGLATVECAVKVKRFLTLDPPSVPPGTGPTVLTTDTTVTRL